MLQITSIKKDFDRCHTGLEKRGIKDPKTLLNQVLQLDDKRKLTQQALDAVLHEANLLAKKIGHLLRQGKKEEAERAKNKTSDLKQKSKTLNEQLSATEKSLKLLLSSIPNIPHTSVPAGNTHKDNETVKTADTHIPNLGLNKKPHWELIEEYNIINFELGNKVTGTGFPFYIGQGARLVRGMINLFLDKALETNYVEVQPPIVINETSGFGTGQLPDKEGQMYYLEGNELYMIPTAEVPITNMYREVVLKQENLPVKHVGHTPCFRREAGSWGAHVRGLNRLHQFDKVEIVQITSPDRSYQVLEEMVAYVESLIHTLELPYRIVKLCGKDLGFAAALTYDFEVYSAAQEKWLEVSSVSNFESYQANRLMLKVKNTEGKKELAHTLNGSALALPRIIAALIENNQQEDHIKIPEVLHPYVGFSTIKK